MLPEPARYKLMSDNVREVYALPPRRTPPGIPAARP